MNWGSHFHCLGGFSISEQRLDVHAGTVRYLRHVSLDERVSLQFCYVRLNKQVVRLALQPPINLARMRILEIDPQSSWSDPIVGLHGYVMVHYLLVVSWCVSLNFLTRTLSYTTTLCILKRNCCEFIIFWCILLYF